MDRVLLLLVVALTVAAVVFGVTVLVTGRDPGLVPAEPDGRAVPLPGARPLGEADVGDVRFDTALRGYRMDQVDQAMRRAAYDIGYKSELIGVLEAEVAALRAGRTADADALRRAREQAAGATAAASPTEARGTVPVGADAHAPARSDRPGGSGVSDVVVEPVPAFAGPDAGSPAAGGTPADVDARPDDAAGGRSEDAFAARPEDAPAVRSEDAPAVRPGDATGVPAGGDGAAEPVHPAGAERPSEAQAGEPRSASGPGDDGTTAPSGDAGRQGPVVRSESA
ncbi:DivIVA domain-containing protein [Micromonospora citrea]|uniref:DivIVA domain-containing protein n=1 Tax=Micromonospora citrea TaxID=47855 RepID=A0A1C6UQ76_9ACTN|nr:DivIVA domain-containing protein [Micromonospora citrea]